jgi:hypothetical protein
MIFVVAMLLMQGAELTLPSRGDERFGRPAGQVCIGNETIDESALEPDCGLPVDTVNGGCNSTPPVFLSVTCGTTLCGNAFFNGTVRDTDWYRLEAAPEATRITWWGEASFPSQPMILTDDGACQNVVVADVVMADAGEWQCTYTPRGDEGAVYLWMGAQWNDIFPCPENGNYVAGVLCGEQCPCLGDLTGDCLVSQADLGMLLAAFGIDDGGDISGDGVTDQVDLGMLLSSFGCHWP